MNKGLFAHIVATIIYVILVLFVLNGESTSIGGRVLIVLLLIVFQFITASFIGSIEGQKWYEEKI